MSQTLKRFKRSKHKFFDALLAYLLGASGLSIATNNKPLEGDSRIGFAGKKDVSGIALYFIPKPVLEMIKKNYYPEEIILIVETFLEEPPVDLPHVISVARDISGNIFQGAFIQYYDSVEEEIVLKYRQKVPMTLSFCRVIRNSFAHGNKIYFNKKQKSKTTWKNLAFDHTNNGETVLWNHIAPADVIILMEEMNSLL